VKAIGHCALSMRWTPTTVPACPPACWSTTKTTAVAPGPRAALSFETTVPETAAGAAAT
jgi:hypothetical protein